MGSAKQSTQIRLNHVSPSCWRVTFDALPDAELDGFIEALAARIASFEKWAIANTKRLVNEASLRRDVEIAAGWDTCMASIVRPGAQGNINALLKQGFHEPGIVEDCLGLYLRKLGR